MAFSDANAESFPGDVALHKQLFERQFDETMFRVPTFDGAVEPRKLHDLETACKRWGYNFVQTDPARVNVTVEGSVWANGAEAAFSDTYTYNASGVITSSLLLVETGTTIWDDVTSVFTRYVVRPERNPAFPDHHELLSVELFIRRTNGSESAYRMSRANRRWQMLPATDV